MSKKMPWGICHICGQYAELSYEHIPPAASYNPPRQRMCTVETLLQAPADKNRAPWDTSGLQYKQFQQGTGFNTLCQSCNSFTGTKYGEMYSIIIRKIGLEISKIPKENRGYGLEIRLEQANLLAFFKQVLSMFCSINEMPFGNKFSQFLLNVDNTDFDQKEYKICMYLHAGRVNRLVPLQVQANIKTGNTAFFSEIAAFPVGFIFYDLSMGTKEFQGCDITSFSACPYDNNQSAILPIPFLSCNTPFGLDFREF